MENSLNYDKQVKEACRLINDEAEYRAILDGTYKQDAKEQEENGGDDDAQEE